MKTKIIVYVCDGEFDNFESSQKRLADVKHPPAKTKRPCLHGCSQDPYKVKCDISNGFCFFAVNDSVENVSSAKQQVNNSIGCSEEILSKALFEYLGLIENFLHQYFVDECAQIYPCVYVMTHWGGGSSRDIDDNEKKLASAVSSIPGERFAGWRMFSASETHRPRLFSDEFSTLIARANRRKAKLPDAKECECILARYNSGDYAAPVNWSETDPKKLYDDIMKHLNH